MTKDLDYGKNYKYTHVGRRHGTGIPAPCSNLI
jgi:hypothetical protein